jgi:hypothetical protein
MNSLHAGSWINYAYVTGLLRLPIFGHLVNNKVTTNLGIVL